jgi:hypothetical protein
MIMSPSLLLLSAFVVSLPDSYRDAFRTLLSIMQVSLQQVRVFYWKSVFRAENTEKAMYNCKPSPPWRGGLKVSLN